VYAEHNGRRGKRQPVWVPPASHRCGNKELSTALFVAERRGKAKYGKRNMDF